MSSASSRRAGPRAPRTGFTLLEVLAAVAILSIWFIVIAGTSVQGLRAEGMSMRRLEAALLADRIVADLEAATLDGTVPEASNDRSQDGIFTITTQVKVFSLGLGGGDRAARAPAQEPEPEPQGEGDMHALLSSEMPGQSRNLRTIDVRVTWREGAAERSVHRTSYAFDLLKAAEVYNNIPGGGSGGTTPAGTPTQGQGGDPTRQGTGGEAQ